MSSEILTKLYSLFQSPKEETQIFL